MPLKSGSMLQTSNKLSLALSLRSKYSASVKSYCGRNEIWMYVYWSMDAIDLQLDESMKTHGGGSDL